MVQSATFQRQQELARSDHTVIPVISRKEYETERAWGLYSSVDVYNCNKKKIASEAAICLYTKELCDRLGVTRHGEPLMILFGNDPSIFGWSMAQMIETSLVSGHFIQLPRIAYVDIFSCKYYDAQKIIEFTVDFFGGDSYTFHSVLRKGKGVHSVQDLFTTIGKRNIEKINGESV